MTAVRSDAHPTRRPRRARFRRSIQAGAVVLAVALTGCSSSDYDDLDVFGVFEEDPPPPESAGAAKVRERADAQSAAAQDAETPSLTTVPARPDAGSSTVRERVLEGLVADRENARYTDEAIRLQESAPPPAPARDAAAREPVRQEPATPPPAPPAAPETSAPPPAPAAPPPATPPPVTVSDEATPAPPPAAPPPPAASSGPSSADRQPGTPRPPQTDSSVTVDPGAIDSAAPAPSFGGREEQVAAIQFAHGSAQLDDRDRQVLAAVAAAQRKSGETVLVVGHASSRTQQLDLERHERANFQMSIARANAVAQALIAAGVAAEKVRAEAASDDAPIYVEAMPSGEAGNRRADVFFIR